MGVGVCAGGLVGLVHALEARHVFQGFGLGLRALQPSHGAEHIMLIDKTLKMMRCLPKVSKSALCLLYWYIRRPDTRVSPP